MEKLIKMLNIAADAYYNSGKEIMSNKEYDELYDKLVKMEKETGVILPNSPTQRAGFTVMDKLPKVKHEFPALSLDKTKDISEFPKVFGVRDNLAVVMYKMDGSTIQLTYNNGYLITAATRGNGEVGQDISHNAPYITGIPLEIPYKGKLIVRGEAIMSYSEFNRINSQLSAEEQYKNPRNLANSTISLLDSREMAQREICFYAFNMVGKSDDMPFSFKARLEQLFLYGFNVVENVLADVSNLISTMDDFTKAVPEKDIPVDGLVVALNDVQFAVLQTGTGHNPHKLVGYAFKWEDETTETVLREIEWSASRTGLLNPVAIFDPVELEGTTVSRASLHNVSYILDKNLQVGDRITVYKANKIIPQVDENLDMERHGHVLPGYIDGVKTCPVCGGETEIVRSVANGSSTLTLHCENPDCTAKHIGRFVHFCERDCMNIVGLSEATIEKFVCLGWLKSFADIYTLCDEHGDELAKMEGFGEKSVEKLRTAIEASRQTSFVPFIHALGIPNVGKGQAKLLSQRFGGDVNKFFDAAIGMNGETGFEDEEYDFQSIEGIGEIIEKSIREWANVKLCSIYVDCPGQSFGDSEVERVKGFLHFTVEKESGDKLAGKTFVITGSLNHYENRDALVEVIEANGGKTSGSVSAKTSYLINNDAISTSSKNMNAQKIGVPIISEEDFMQMLLKI